MNLFNTMARYGLAKETGLILGMIGVVLAIIGIFLSLSSKSKFKRPIIILCVAISLGSIPLLWNYYTTIYVEKIQVVSVPYVEGLPYSNAQMVMRFSGLNERAISADGGVVSPEQEVLLQNPSFTTEVLAGSDVILYMGMSGDTKPYVPDVTLFKEKLTISIDSLQEAETYHYEYSDPQNPQQTFLIDLGKGMCGTFSYSRPLTEEEKANWYHGGKLYDKDGNEVGKEGNWPTFWSNSDGRFAFEFPLDLPAGQYTYELYQNICGQAVSDTVEFTVK